MAEPDPGTAGPSKGSCFAKQMGRYADYTVLQLTIVHDQNDNVASQSVPMPGELCPGVRPTQSLS